MRATPDFQRFERRGRHVLGARKKNERETRKLRCAKPSAPKSSRRRMKPILDRTKSKAEAYGPGAAPKGTFPSPFSFRLFSWNFRDCLLWKALRKSAAVRCVLRPSKVAPAHRVSQPNLRGVYPRRRCPLWVMSEHFTKFRRCPLYPRKRTSVECLTMSALCQKRNRVMQHKLDEPGTPLRQGRGAHEKIRPYSHAQMSTSRSTSEESELRRNR